MKRLESMVFVGWVLLLIAIIMDDVPTLILMNQGFSVLETNPVFQKSFSILIFLGFLFLMYIFTGWALNFVNNKYRNLYKNKKPGYKYYDIFVFLFCLIVMFVVVMKISAGISNITMMVKYSTPEGKELIDKAIQDFEDLKQNHPDEYNKFISEYYNESSTKVNYLQFLLISMGGFILFRIGNRVEPNDLGDCD
jgi:hypothetical protein